MNTIEFKNRREEIMEMMGKGSMILLSAAVPTLRNKDIHYPYRQNSNFIYLTGFPEPNAVAVLIPEREQGQYILFCCEDIQKDHKHIGLEEACTLYGADDAFPINDIDDIIPCLMESCSHVYYLMNDDKDFFDKIGDWSKQLESRVRNGVVVPEMGTLEPLLHEMRLFKTEEEEHAIRTAVDVSVSAHKRAMQFCRPGLYEYELEAEIHHEFLRKGCRSSAFPTSVSSGKNACTIHYSDNNALLKSGDLILIDAGAEYDYYASDITRTFPINGHFTSAQKSIYELVLAAQRAALNTLYPGNHWDQIHKSSAAVVTQGLIDLGLLIGKFEVLLEEEAYTRFYLYNIAHWIGIDVHDVGNYKVDNAWREFEAGCIIAIEPGIYIPAAEDIAEEWWDIGVRIEDNVLITENGHEILTKNLPKTISEIEDFMAGKSL